MSGLASRRTGLLVGVYAAGLACWWWFAASWAPSLIVSAREGRASAAVAKAVAWYGGDRRLDDVLRQANETAAAVVLAGVLHLGLVLLFGVWRRRQANGRTAWQARSDRANSIVLTLLGLGFFLISILTGSFQDYFLFGQIWDEILKGHDPWFLVQGRSGMYPLNAYGPLFTAFAPLTLINPLAPKLLFAASFWAFGGWLILDFAPSRQLPAWAGLLLLLWVANPYPWIEIAVFGHFDILVGLLCIAAVEGRMREDDLASAAWISAGALLKYFPGVLVPFLMLEGRRIRLPFLAATAAIGLLGMSLACLIWGPAALRPLTFAVSREPAHMSIFRFLVGVHSPFSHEFFFFSFEEMASPVLLMALAWLWSWTRRTGFEMFASCVLAVTVTLVLYKVGFAQYPMALYALGAYWLVRDHATLKHRAPLAAAFCAYFAWVMYFDVLLWEEKVYPLIDWAGLVTFALGGLLVVSIVRAARFAPSSAVVQDAALDVGPGG